MLSDTIVRLIRTWVPIAVGALIANLPFLADVFNSDALVALAISVYYAVAAWLETQYPVFGWLLGIPKARSL